MKNICFSLHYFIDKHIYNLGWLGCSFGSCDHQLHHYNQHRNGNGSSFISLFYLNRTFFPYSLLSSLFFYSFKLNLINWYLILTFFPMYGSGWSELGRLGCHHRHRRPRRCHHRHHCRLAVLPSQERAQSSRHCCGRVQD